MPIHYARSLTSQQSSLRTIRHLGFTLAFVAGATNAGAYLAVRLYTSHMTGIVSSMADNLALGEFTLALGAVGAVSSFLLGAMTSAIMINYGRRRALRSQFALPLLLEAGFADRNGDGVLEDESGAPFEFELTFFQGNEDTRRMVLFLRDLYARAGVVMKPRPTEWSVMVENLQRKDFDAITLAWTSGVEVDIFQMFHSSQTLDGGDNFINHRNPELDRLIDAARAEVDEDRRMRLWREAEAVMVADQPYTFLLRRQSLVFIDGRIANVHNTALGLNLMAVPVEVFVPADRQRRR